jgi:hypothetical protein
MQVRSYRVSDHQALRALFARAGEGSPAATLWGHPESEAALYLDPYLQADPGSVLLAVVDDVPVGYRAGGARPRPTRSHRTAGPCPWPARLQDGRYRTETARRDRRGRRPWPGHAGCRHGARNAPGLESPEVRSTIRREAVPNPGRRSALRSRGGSDPSHALWFAVRRGPDPPSGTKNSAAGGSMAQKIERNGDIWHKFALRKRSAERPGGVRTPVCRNALRLSQCRTPLTWHRSGPSWHSSGALCAPERQRDRSGAEAAAAAELPRRRGVLAGRNHAGNGEEGGALAVERAARAARVTRRGSGDQRSACAGPAPCASG